MVADIQAPDYETRLAILKQYMDQKGVVVPNEYIDLIAKSIENNVRELEVSLNKIITLMNLGDNPTYEDIARLLQVDIESKRRRVSPQKVLKITSEIYDIPISDIKGNRRTAYVALVRQVVMYLLRNELDLPLESVAKEVNRKDHTTVLHACEKIEHLINTDSRFAEKVELCRRELRG
jgi:chromosomal replication initiator protein